MKEEKENKNNSLVVIVPCYNEEECIGVFYDEIIKQLENLHQISDYCILFVDDGSKDKTLQRIKDIQKKDKKIKYISFSRNFGKESAIFAGLDQAYNYFDSTYYMLIDADLQDPPSLISKMITDIINDENCECVRTRRISRKGEPFLRTIFSNMFYKIINKISDIEVKSGARDFSIMSNKFVKALLDCGEYNRFFKGISSWVGFKVHWLDFENIERKQGSSGWSFFQLFKYSVQAIVAYTTWPLAAISVIGVIMSFIAFIFLIVVFIKALYFGDPVAGWPSLTCIVLITAGMILFALGVLGLYFEKMYLEVKKRPLYIIDNKSL